LSSDRIASVRAVPFRLLLRFEFAIAGGAQAAAEGVLVRVRLADGTVGWGECAPLPAYDGQTAARTLAEIRRAAPALRGLPSGRAERVREALGESCRGSCARAGLEMAVLDAWARSRRLPLWAFFGGAGVRLRTGMTVPILPPDEARDEARRIARLGIRGLKVKVGRDPDEDAERVAAAWSAGRFSSLILDANGGYSDADALRLLRRLARRALRPDLFEQPVAPDDLDGMARVARLGRVDVAADESARRPEDLPRLIRRRAAQCVNLKIMKSGVAGALELARAARAAGLRLMIGGNVETRLAMACAAHLACGLGGFDFVDLDTPLYFAREPFRGPSPGKGGLWDLSRVRAGIGVAPPLDFS
jgi:L-alanine-DL-glutamate epimerase-like enolase superfamily enzyme